MELKLKNVTSYSKDNFTEINLMKKINIIYGQNGSGKSTISNFFYKIGDAIFSDCKCTLIEDYRPLVYNTKFIEENFYNTSEQKGVFTLSKENAEIEKEIIEKEALKYRLTEQYKEKKALRDKAVQESAQAESICTESIWAKTENIRTSSLKSLMRGSLGSKKNFYVKLNESIRLSNINLENLAREYEELLTHKNNESPILTSPIRQFLNKNEHELLATPIIDLSNSYLSESIRKLQNLDWVKTGKELYIEDDTCPFCQEKTNSSISKIHCRASGRNIAGLAKKLDTADITYQRGPMCFGAGTTEYLNIVLPLATAAFGAIAGVFGAYLQRGKKLRVVFDDGKVKELDTTNYTPDELVSAVQKIKEIDLLD